LHPDLPAIDLGFEAISAVCTSGMSRDITPKLAPPAKYVLVIAMFFGRVGILTSLIALLPRRDPPAYRLPEGNVVIN
jgi:trk system potassium uptake protein TrkH